MELIASPLREDAGASRDAMAPFSGLPMEATICSFAALMFGKTSLVCVPLLLPPKAERPPRGGRRGCVRNAT